MLNRRELLRAAGLGTAALWLGCGRGPGLRRPEAQLDPDAMRAALRDAVAILGARLAEPVAFAIERRRIHAVVDLVERAVTDDRSHLVVLGGRDGAGRWQERALDRAAPALIRQHARELAARVGGAPPAVVAIGAPLDRAMKVAVDPATLTVDDWQMHADHLAVRADARSNSRIIYRAVYAITEDERSWVVTATRDRSQRLIRTRLGATAIAWHGSAPVAGQIEVAGGFGPEFARLTDAALAGVNDDALALTTPGGFTAIADAEVVLAPALVAAIVDRLGAIATGPVVAVDLPQLTTAEDAGYASYYFDARGDDARAGAPRRGGDGRLRMRSSNLVVTPGAEDALEDAVVDGYLLDGVAHVGGSDDALALRVGRARRLHKGRPTGHAWRDVELRGRALELLAATTGVGRVPTTIAIDDDGPPHAVVTPAVRTRAALRPAQRRP